MKVLINLAPLKAGGGQNVGINFLRGLEKIAEKDIDFFFYITEKTEISKIVSNRYPSKSVEGPYNTLRRIAFERIKLTRYVQDRKIDVIYSCFGYAAVNKNIIQICGVAESNLMFPEIDFWKEYKGVSRFAKEGIDSYRKWGYRRAHALVYENEAMFGKSSKIFDSKDAICIKPSLSIENGNAEFKFKKTNDKSVVGLFLCGWQLNKNILLIPELVYELKAIGIPFEVIFTVSEIDNNPIATQFKRLVVKLKVSDYIHLVGKVTKEQLREVYNVVDFVFLLSRLESFSNNIIEAWYFRKPLIISDAAWARGICKEAAIYVNRDDARGIAQTIKNVIEDGYIKSVVRKGIDEYESYPSIEERTSREVEYIKKITQKNKE